MDELLKASINQGLGYGMFVFLLLYVLKTTGDREKKYQDTIDKLADKFNIIEDVKKDVVEIKEKIFK
ncbi:BhlA/UviB family holin-like peptide [Clostridium cadaveris]|uniref:BhlA/UviB family holin-like peptide n=1 Tax=Clostridium cadaveris TaxID=1529 RepID=UPI0015B5869B|nr:BhlA/UviB family holin-like peptide [Clostridium cadaveris]NWK12983.1 UviB-like protein [Clostridium cadaveris]